MTLKDAIKELEYYQEWRMGADIKQPAPRQITKAIEMAIYLMKEQNGNN